jgi:urease accessory protein
LLTQIAPAQEHHELPYLRFAYEAGNLDELCALDREIDAWKLAAEAREASAQLGGRRLAALRKISAAAELTDFATALTAGRARGHHLIVCALQARAGNIPLAAALTAYLYQALAAICAAALKLIRIGQDGCQRVLRKMNCDAHVVVQRSLEVARSDAGWFSPMLEIAAMRHARADERLFIS